MANQAAVLLAFGAAMTGIFINFSLHKIEEGTFSKYSKI
jgi:hypothetical protein